METTNIKQMSNQQLIDTMIYLDKVKKANEANLNDLKAEMQERGLAILTDRNIRYIRYYGEKGTCAVTDAMSLDILNVDKVKEALGAAVFEDKVKMNVKTEYKPEAKLERMLKAVFMGDYILEMDMSTFLDSMSIKPDAKQKTLLLKKLKGNYEQDKTTLQAVFADYPSDQDWDVELWYIYKIKNAELIKSFLPEKDLKESLNKLRSAILVESKVALKLDYETEDN